MCSAQEESERALIVQANARLAQILVNRTCYSCKEHEEDFKSAIRECRPIGHCFCYPVRPYQLYLGEPHGNS